MKIFLEVKIPDTPGSLIKVINPISKAGGNIFGILHHHDRKENNLIPVEITFELSDKSKNANMKSIKKSFKKHQIKIVQLDYDTPKKYLTIILTGHVFDTDVSDTIDTLASKQIRVLELQAKFTEISEISNVKLILEFSETMSKNQLIDELKKICEEKRLSLLRE